LQLQWLGSSFLSKKYLIRQNHKIKALNQGLISSFNAFLLSHPPFFMPIWGQKTAIFSPNRHKKRGVAKEKCSF
jgi:hypothetical protein